MPGFAEVADRVWVARYPWCDVNVTAVGGQRGLVVVDTYASTAAAAAVITDLRALARGRVVEIVNTHWHFDHTFGNDALRSAYGPLPIHAHETAVTELERGAAALLAAVAADHDDPHREELLATEVVLPDRPLASVSALDLGDRVLELVHPGRGHTGGDLVVRIPDADVLLAGDLVEQSGPPAYGDDCYPLEWPLTLDTVLGLTTPTTVVVPGHGEVVSREYVEEQRSAIGAVAEIIGDLAGQRFTPEQALTRGEWPYPATVLDHAVRRGFEQVPRTRRRLPLV